MPVNEIPLIIIIRIEVEVPIESFINYSLNQNNAI